MELFIAHIEDIKLQHHVAKCKLHDSIPKLMIAFEVARNGLPSMIGIQLVPLAIGSVSRTTKSTG